MKSKDKGIKYLKAKHKVEKLRRFYWHIAIYVIISTAISTILLINKMSNGRTLEEALLNFNTLSVWLIWGIIIIMHGIRVYVFPKLFGGTWEDKKIEELMDKEL